MDRQGLMADQLRRTPLDGLTQREATIMAMRFGLYDGNPHTLDRGSSRALGLTRERIRQLEEAVAVQAAPPQPGPAQPLLDYAKLNHGAS